MSFDLDPLGLLVILVIILIIAGAGKLSHMGSALDKTMTAYQTGEAEEEEEEIKPRPRKRKKAARRSSSV